MLVNDGIVAVAVVVVAVRGTDNAIFFDDDEAPGNVVAVVEDPAGASAALLAADDATEPIERRCVLDNASVAADDGAVGGVACQLQRAVCEVSKTQRLADT